MLRRTNSGSPSRVRNLAPRVGDGCDEVDHIDVEPEYSKDHPRGAARRHDLRLSIAHVCHRQRRAALLIILTGLLLVQLSLEGRMWLSSISPSIQRYTLLCANHTPGAATEETSLIVRTRKTVVEQKSENPNPAGPFFDAQQRGQRWVEKDASSAVITDVCRHCFQAPASETTTCGQLMHQRYIKLSSPQDAKKKTTIAQQHEVWSTAAQAVANTNPSCQQACFDDCPIDQRTYWRHDAAAPVTRNGTSHFLASIPQTYRLPATAVQNLEHYFEDPAVRYPARTYLFEYNPTVIVLPADQRPNPEAVYLASYRVTNFQYCFKSKANPHLYDLRNKDAKDLPPSQGLVALALLRDDLSVLKDITVDFSSVLRMEDPRLFVLHGQVYLASFEALVPLWLHGIKPHQQDTVELHDYFDKSNGMSVVVRSQPSCCTSTSCSGGKNFNYFTIAGDVQPYAWVETNPLHPRQVEQVDLSATCDQSLARKAEKPAVVYTHDTLHSKESFATVDQLVVLGQRGEKELPYSKERGTACCVPITTDDGQKLLVGVSHTKSRRVPKLQSVLTGRQYYSRLVAFEASAPFAVVATSGTFCMGFPSTSDMKSNYFNTASVKQAFLLGESMECPKITFVSGITETAGDPTKVIISYGINDCTGRMVVVDKSDLVDMLFHPSRRLELGLQ